MITLHEKGETKTYVPAVKAGACYNGAHRDAGGIVHLVPPLPPRTTGFWGTRALCNTRPGNSRGYGWLDAKKDITCPRCLEKMKRLQSKGGV